MATPLGAVCRGLLAGAIGTGVMTVYQIGVQRLLSQGGSGGDSGEQEGDGQNGEGRTDPWSEAPAPAQFAHKLVKGLYGRDIPAEKIGTVTNVTHWAYGTTMGALYGLVQGTLRARVVPHGLAFGALVWAHSYAQMVPAGVFSPPWTYPPKELALDFSYHAVYGLGVAGAHRLVEALEPD